jgi:hypothetical protein
MQSYDSLKESKKTKDVDFGITEINVNKFVKKRIEYVPSWFYDKSEDVCGRFTKPGFLWTVNMLACIFHCILIVVTILVSTQGGKGLDTPTLTIYNRKLVWNATGAESMLTPTLQPAGWKLPLSIVTIVFFALSALAHFIICVFNFNQAFALRDLEARKITAFTGWYFRWLHECRQPLR